MTPVKHVKLPLCLKDGTQKLSCLAFALQSHYNKQKEMNPLKRQVHVLNPRVGSSSRIS